MRYGKLLSSLGVAGLLSVAPAYAQNAADTDDSEIVVTGTLLRGVAPVGTNVVGLSEADIQQGGALDTNQVLARIPQVTSAFNSVPVLQATDPGNSIIRPQLRNFGNVSGSTSTLVLIDGHRSVNAGITITAPDPGVIPPAVLERIDVVPDGGSATYGSDAVAGVINFITRSRFDGVQADARYGVADGYDQYDANLTMGTDWGNGGAYIAFSHAEHDSLLGRELSWLHQPTPSTGFCTPGTVIIGSTSYALPGRIPGTIAQCDNTDDAAFVPEETRDSIFGVFNQELTDWLELDIRAFYSERTNDIAFDRGDSGTITSANPFYVPIDTDPGLAGVQDPGSQTVNFDYGNLVRTNELEEYGVTAELSAELGRGWRLTGLLNWGRSVNRNIEPMVDEAVESAALTATTTGAALNPYDIGATNAAVLDSISWNDEDRGRQTMNDLRVILDGSLLSLPGGDVRLAVGAEYIEEESDFVFTNSPTDAVTTTPSRDITSFFGEVVVPIVGRGNAMPGIESLEVSGAVRHDDYSDVGETTNSKIGLNYEPVEWMTFRANWGESFIAPSVADTSGAPDTRAILFGFSPFIASGDVNGVNENLPQILLAGGNADLQPQTAETWSAGFDIRPPFVSGLTLSATYYNIETENQISNLFAAVFAPLGTDALYQPQYSNLVILNPSQAFATNYIAGLPIVNAGGGNSAADIYAIAGSVWSIVDFRRQNLGLVEQSGIDFNANYDFDTSFAAMTVNLGGSYLLGRNVAIAAGAPMIDEVDSPGVSRLSLQASLGATMGNFFTSLTVRHSLGYDISPAVGGQTSVDSFTTTDVFASYDFEGSGMLEGVTLTGGVNNLFDAEPPNYNGARGFANGSTLGRLFQVGLRKRF